MARLTLSPRAESNLTRIFEFYAKEDQALAARMDVHPEPTSNPEIGRRAEKGFRELIIPFGKTGFVALYDYKKKSDVVHIASIRHPREAGYR